MVESGSASGKSKPFRGWARIENDVHVTKRRQTLLASESRSDSVVRVIDFDLVIKSRKSSHGNPTI